MFAEDVDFDELTPDRNLVVATKRVHLSDFPNAFNPSMIQVEGGFLLSFRYRPDPRGLPWLNYIGIVLLDEQFRPMSKPQLLNTHVPANPGLSQAEDARLFLYQGRVFLIYNDNRETIALTVANRRDMYIAELVEQDGCFQLMEPFKLYYEAQYFRQMWQKNWAPFEWENQLMCIYTVNPHEIVFLNQYDGECYHYHDTWTPLAWKWGPLRGGTPPQVLNENEYLVFIHSSIETFSPYISVSHRVWHYFMGAYTFSRTPPFQMMRVTNKPIVGRHFYTPTTGEKRVVFPGGIVLSKEAVYVAYGKDDAEIWIATIDKEALMAALEPVEAWDE